MGQIVIACYRPKPGAEAALKELMRTHVQRLAAEGLVTNRTPILMQVADGTFVEVFEWKSEEAVEAAHTNPAVLKMWEEYEEVCDYVPVSAVPEASELFSGFRPVVFEE
jgi:quinol monooxygenase YgiN